MQNNLLQLRLKRNLSAAALARMVSVSRQTIHAIEAGDYVPNTTVALRLAHALDVAVEDLFQLPDGDSLPSRHSEQAKTLPGSKSECGQAVQLCRVDQRLMAASLERDPWFLPASDAIVTRKPARDGRTTVEAYAPGDYQNRLLVAGCDPAVSVLARHLLPAGIELVFVQRNSSQSLKLLREACVHIAGTHLRDEASGESNIPEIRRTFPRNSCALFSFAVWEEGILTAATNPKGIKGIDDLARKDVSMVNREEGSGSRRLLESQLAQQHLNPKCIRGYERSAPGHFSAAREVAERRADCCIATRVAAHTFGLDFIPLVTERYDFAIRRQHLKLPAVETLLDVLNRAAFRRELEAISGYETRVSGQRVL